MVWEREGGKDVAMSVETLLSQNHVAHFLRAKIYVLDFEKIVNRG